MMFSSAAAFVAYLAMNEIPKVVDGFIFQGINKNKLVAAPSSLVSSTTTMLFSSISENRQSKETDGTSDDSEEWKMFFQTDFENFLDEEAAEAALFQGMSSNVLFNNDNNEEAMDIDEECLAFAEDDQTTSSKSKVTPSIKHSESTAHTGSGSGVHLNKHLFRYFTDISADCWIRTIPQDEFLHSCNFTSNEVCRYEQGLTQHSWDVMRNLAPKVRFLVKTLGGGQGDLCDGQFHSITGDDNDFVPHNLLVSDLGKQAIAPNTAKFWESRLEAVLAPRHAYLVYHGKDGHNLPYGQDLLQNNGELLQELLKCKSNKDFIALCNQWEGYPERKEKADQIHSLQSKFDHSVTSGDQLASKIEILTNKLSTDSSFVHSDDTDLTVPKLQLENAKLKSIIDEVAEHLSEMKSTVENLTYDHEAIVETINAIESNVVRSSNKKNEDVENRRTLHTVERFKAFQEVFRSGLLPLAKNNNNNNNIELKILHLHSSEMMELLLLHGANPIEKDQDGRSILHWAAGSGNYDGTKVLMQILQSKGEGENYSEVAQNAWGGHDFATPLHWASYGGHDNICRLILEDGIGDGDENGSRQKQLVNSVTISGNTPLMWAARFGNLDVVKTLIAHGADSSIVNQNGLSVAHFAASSGNVKLCRYLYEQCDNIDFTTVSTNGKITPLSNAVIFGGNNNDDVTKWILSTFYHTTQKESKARNALLQHGGIKTKEYANKHLIGGGDGRYINPYGKGYGGSLQP